MLARPAFAIVFLALIALIGPSVSGSAVPVSGSPETSAELSPAVPVTGKEGAAIAAAPHRSLQAQQLTPQQKARQEARKQARLEARKQAQQQSSPPPPTKLAKFGRFLTVYYALQQIDIIQDIGFLPWLGIMLVNLSTLLADASRWLNVDFKPAAIDFLSSAFTFILNLLQNVVAPWLTDTLLPSTRYFWNAMWGEWRRTAEEMLGPAFTC